MILKLPPPLWLTFCVKEVHTLICLMGNKHIFFPLTKSLNHSAESWKVSVILSTLLMECLGHCPSINSSNAGIHHLWTPIVGTEPGQWASVFLLHFRSSRWVSGVWWEKWTENECRDEMAMNAIWHSALKELLIITTSSYPGDYCKTDTTWGLFKQITRSSLMLACRNANIYLR